MYCKSISGPLRLRPPSAAQPGFGGPDGGRGHQGELPQLRRRMRVRGVTVGGGRALGGMPGGQGRLPGGQRLPDAAAGQDAGRAPKVWLKFNCWSVTVAHVSEFQVPSRERGVH